MTKNPSTNFKMDFNSTNICIFAVNYSSGASIRLDNNRLTILNEAAFKPVLDFFATNGLSGNSISISQSNYLIY